MVIVDTTVWVDYFQGVENPETDWLNTELDRQRLGLTDIILCEVLQGVTLSPLLACGDCGWLAGLHISPKAINRRNMFKYKYL